MRKAINIIWDIEVEDCQEYDDDDLGLPNEVDIPNDIEDDYIADYLSDEYGFCVETFEIL